MQLTTHTDYALRLLIFLMVHPGRIVSTKEVAAAYGISANHLTKIAKQLTKNGWLVAVRGGGGGLMLASHTPDTPVGEIVRSTESIRHVAECFNVSANFCPIPAVCRLKPILHRARKAFFEVLDGVTIREIAANPRELKPILTANLKRASDGR